MLRIGDKGFVYGYGVAEIYVARAVNLRHVYRTRAFNCCNLWWKSLIYVHGQVPCSIYYMARYVKRDNFRIIWFWKAPSRLLIGLHLKWV